MWHNVKQNTEEPCECCGETWMDLRAGKVTGSGKSIGAIMANYGKAFGEPAKNLAASIAAYELGGTPLNDNYTNSHMERGHEEEPLARELYEELFFTDVYNGGFYDNDKTGCSPDGNIDHNGVAEIKCVISGVQYKTIKRGSYDPKYKWQLVHNLKESRREWIDYISYCSELPRDNRLFVVRVYAEEMKNEFKMVDLRLKQFFELVEEVKATFARAA